MTSPRCFIQSVVELGPEFKSSNSKAHFSSAAELLKQFDTNRITICDSEKEMVNSILGDFDSFLGEDNIYVGQMWEQKA